jgi:hypothetical protein
MNIHPYLHVTSSLCRSIAFLRAIAYIKRIRRGRVLLATHRFCSDFLFKAPIVRQDFLFKMVLMKEYYEILDVKYWSTKTWKFNRRQEEFQIYKVLLVMGLAFLFWSLAEVQNIPFAKVVNLIGWGFALWSLLLVVHNPNFWRKRVIKNGP